MLAMSVAIVLIEQVKRPTRVWIDNRSKVVIREGRKEGGGVLHVALLQFDDVRLNLREEYRPNAKAEEHRTAGQTLVIRVPLQRGN